MTTAPKFAMGQLDHVHIRVPDRTEAVAWYCEHLGFEPVEKYQFWADGITDGPVQISADGGKTMLALFEASDGHPMITQETGVAFSVDAAVFTSFAHSLPNGIPSAYGRPLAVEDLVDLDLCWAYGLSDPWGNQYELNSYDYDVVKRDVVDAIGFTPVKYWPDDALASYRA